jgi:hypothetical protein
MGLESRRPTVESHFKQMADGTALGLGKTGERADEQGIIRIVELDSLLPLYAGLKNEEYC